MYELPLSEMVPLMLFEIFDKHCSVSSLLHDSTVHRTLARWDEWCALEPVLFDSKVGLESPGSPGAASASGYSAGASSTDQALGRGVMFIQLIVSFALSLSPVAAAVLQLYQAFWLGQELFTSSCTT